MVFRVKFVFSLLKCWFLLSIPNTPRLWSSSSWEYQSAWSCKRRCFTELRLVREFCRLTPAMAVQDPLWAPKSCSMTFVLREKSEVTSERRFGKWHFDANKTYARQNQFRWVQVFLCEIFLIYKPAMPENRGEDSTQVVSMMSSCHDSSTTKGCLCSGQDTQLDRNWEPRFRSLFLYKTRPSPEWRENTHIDWPLSSDVLWCCVNLEFWERKTLAKVYDSLVRTRLRLSWNWSTVEGRLGKMAKCQIGQKPSLPGLQQMEVARCSRRPTGRGPWRWTSGKHQIRHFVPTKVTTKPTKTTKHTWPQWTLKPKTLSPRQGQSPLHIAAASGASNSAETKFDMSVFNAVSSLCVNSFCWLLAPSWALSIHQMPRFGGEVWDVWIWCFWGISRLAAVGCGGCRHSGQGRPPTAFAKRLEEGALFLCRMLGAERRGRRMFVFFAKSFVLINVQTIHRVQNASKVVSQAFTVRTAAWRCWGAFSVPSLDAMPWALLHVLVHALLHIFEQPEQLLVQAVESISMGSTLKAAAWCLKMNFYTLNLSLLRVILRNEKPCLFGFYRMF